MKRLMLLPLLALLSANAFAATKTVSRDIELSPRDAARIINSLQISKPGQARVFAVDGSEYTGAEAMWLKSQLRAAERAMSLNETPGAESHMHLVMAALKTHSSHR